MKIERASEKDFAELKTLWSVVFDEEPQFLEHFFSKRFHPEHIVLARKGGMIVSALHALPSTYRQKGEEKPCSFIVGAATYASHRKQGIMGELLAYTKATTEGPVTLFPAVRPFYEAHGYLTTSSMEEYALSPDKQESKIPSVSPTPSQLDKIYREATGEDGALMRDEEGWLFLISGYDLIALPDAYAFINEGIAVEAMATSKESAKSLLSLLQQREIGRIRVLPNSPFSTLLAGPAEMVPMGMSTDPSMAGVYIAEQY